MAFTRDEVKSYMKQAGANRGSGVTALAEGLSKIRLLPQGGRFKGTVNFFQKYGTHFLKVPQSDGTSKMYKFICNRNTNNSKCNLCDDYWTHYHAAKAAKANGTYYDPLIAKIADEARADTKWLVNAMILSGDEPGKVVPLRLTKGLFDAIDGLIAADYYNLFDPALGNNITVVMKKRTAGFGLEVATFVPEAASSIGLNDADLLDLKDVLDSELANAYPADAWSGDWRDPVDPHFARSGSASFAPPAISAGVASSAAYLSGPATVATLTPVTTVSTPAVADAVDTSSLAMSREDIEQAIAELEAKKATATATKPAAATVAQPAVANAPPSAAALLAELSAMSGS
jgi:gp32 DNA binding protein like